MKKFFLFFSLIPAIIFAQFAKVADRDGFVNVRQKPDSKSKVLHKATNGSIFFIDNKGNDSRDWDFVTSADGKNSVEGYIHASRLVEIADLEEIPEAITENGCAKFLLKNFEINVCTKDFTKEDIKISAAETAIIIIKAWNFTARIRPEIITRKSAAV